MNVNRPMASHRMRASLICLQGYTQYYQAQRRFAQISHAPHVNAYLSSTVMSVAFHGRNSVGPHANRKSTRAMRNEKLICVVGLGGGLLRYKPSTETSSRTDAADFCSAAFSSALSLISMIFSMPFAPSFTGTPTNNPLIPYSPSR